VSNIEQIGLQYAVKFSMGTQVNLGLRGKETQGWPKISGFAEKFWTFTIHALGIGPSIFWPTETQQN
jgi:hypothetical protein